MDFKNDQLVSYFMSEYYLTLVQQSLIILKIILKFQLQAVWHSFRIEKIAESYFVNKPTKISS